MVVLRSGLDKIMFTVRESHFKTYPYPKDVAMKYADRLKRIVFSDRSAFTVQFDKYPHKTWKYLDEDRSTYAVEYFLRLDGMRQMRVWLNCMRLFNVKHDLEPSPKALWDDNFVDPDYVFTMATFVQMVKDEIEHFKDDYITIRKEVFDEVIHPLDITVDTHTLEVVREGLGLHTSDVMHTFQDFPMCDNVKVYHNETNTHYLNTSAKRQLKFYNKGVGVLRMEATFNYRPKDIVLNWVAPTYDIAQSIEMEVDTLLLDMGLPGDWYDKLQINRENLVWLIANAFNLRDEDDEVQTVLMKILLTTKEYRGRRDNRAMIQRLKRKRLIKPSTYGKYVPTERLRLIQNLYNILERSHGFDEPKTKEREE